MNLTLLFSRLIFFLFSLLFLTTFMASNQAGSLTSSLLIGMGLGALLFLLLLSFEFLLHKCPLRSLNTFSLGLFFGYLMGQALMLIFDTLVDLTSISIALQPQTMEMIKISIFLFGAYLGTMLTLRYAHEIHISIPFVRFSHTQRQKKDLILDLSVLSDSRMIDLANSGLVDHALVLPHFVVKELASQAEILDEAGKVKARKGLETIKKLQEIPALHLRINKDDFPEVLELQQKLIRLARALEGNILSAELTKVQIPALEGIQIVNIHALANALKPLMQAGESLKIKVQRAGKEPLQGVGYLDDGTMVVINGGGDHIGEFVDTQVLSVKHTTSGRMVFCNLKENLIPSHYAHESAP